MAIVIVMTEDDEDSVRALSCSFADASVPIVFEWRKPQTPCVNATLPLSYILCGVTDRVRKVILLAAEEAVRHRHHFIGSEHLLLATVKEGFGVASHVLHSFGVDVDKMRGEITTLVPAGKQGNATTGLSFNDEAIRVLVSAWREAHALGQIFIGTEHLLLGVLANRDAMTTQMFSNLTVRIDDVRDAILDMLGPHQQS